MQDSTPPPPRPPASRECSAAIYDSSAWLIAVMVAVVLLAAIFGLASLQAATQSDPARADVSTPPALTDAQRYRLISLSQEVEIHRLRLQIATQALQQAIAEAQVPGYRLTEQLTYEPIGELADDPAPPPASQTAAPEP